MKMNRLCATAFVVLFCASTAFGDVVDKGLSGGATEQLKTSTRQMIGSGIDRDDAIKMTRVMLENRFREEQLLRAHEILMNAQKQGLPVEPIINKAYEGMAKQVQDRDIVHAMERVRSRYAFAFEQARHLTREKTQIRLLGDNIAGCLASGMNDGDIGRIMHSLQERTREMTQNQAHDLALETFKAARNMARVRVSSELTSDVVCQALQHGYTARDMERMNHSFMTRSRQASSTDLARRYAKAIKGGAKAESLGSSGKGGSGGSGGSGHGGSSGHGGGSGSGGGSGGGMK